MFSRPELCLSEIGCVSEILVVFLGLSCVFQTWVVFVRPWFRFGGLSCVFRP